MAEVISSELIHQIVDQAAHSEPVRQALNRKADRVKARAALLAAKTGMPGFSRSMTIQAGTRPGEKSPTGIKRMYSEVGGTVPDGEHGTITPMQVMSRARNA
jgi:hypothetical protein